MPPLGLSAVPLPKKKLKMLPEAAAVAAAVGAAAPPKRPPEVVVAAAAFTVLDAPSSRREAARAVQASGARAGASPLPPVASHDSRLLLTPETEVDAAARGVATAAAGAAAETASTAAAGAAAAGASLLVAAGVTASEGVEATAVRGVSATASLAEPLLPADGTDTTGVSLWARRGLTAAEEDAPLRGVAELSTEPAEPAPARRGAAALVDAVDGPIEDWSPVDPAEPVVSANANGTVATAEPIPNTTANTPTRPTYRDNPDCTVDSPAITARQPHSITRTRPSARTERPSRPPDSDDSTADIQATPPDPCASPAPTPNSSMPPAQLRSDIFLRIYLQEKP